MSRESGFDKLTVFPDEIFLGINEYDFPVKVDLSGPFSSILIKGDYEATEPLLNKLLESAEEKGINVVTIGVGTKAIIDAWNLMEKRIRSESDINSRLRADSLKSKSTATPPYIPKWRKDNKHSLLVIKDIGVFGYTHLFNMGKNLGTDTIDINGKKIKVSHTPLTHLQDLVINGWRAGMHVVVRSSGEVDTHLTDTIASWGTVISSTKSKSNFVLQQKGQDPFEFTTPIT